MNPQLQLTDGTLTFEGASLLSSVPQNVEIVADPLGIGVFLRFTAAKAAARHVWPLGTLSCTIRWTCCHRYEPFWMTSKAGKAGGEVPPETQYLLCEQEDNSVLLLVPLFEKDFRASLQGTGEQGLELVGESGDGAVVATEMVGLFVAAGADPYSLLPAAAESVAAHLKSGKLRREKPIPEFAEQFGWCTWDAFYKDVSKDKVRTGLESFRVGGVEPKYLILDDGWQPIRKHATGEERLTGFAANDKFPGGLAPTVSMANEEFGIETFLVWHALHGYWGGVDEKALPGYRARALPRQFSQGIRHYYPNGIPYFGDSCGVVPTEHIYRFYQDYHRHLRLQGVDGVKVDNQAAVEGVSEGMGGRVYMMQRYHEALEGSVQTHFEGNLINCMSCANEMLYSTLASTLTRTSTDFWPNKPESHGLHLYVNAQVSLWFGEFVHPDWDMFQSGHERGGYHAAGRVVSGSPVYVSDKPDAHDFDLLKKLVLPDGSVLRCPGPGVPTRDCLFADPTREDVLLKIFNVNERLTGVVGVFHARYEKEGETAPVTGVVRPSDVVGMLGAERYAVYAHQAHELRILVYEEEWPITLPALGWEVFTIVPLDPFGEGDTCTAVGLADKLNSGAAVLEWSGNAGLLRCGGEFIAWCASAPTSVLVDGAEVPFTYEDASQTLTVSLPDTGDVIEVEVE